MNAWFLIAGFLVIIYITALVYKLFFVKKNKTSGQHPPDDIYPLW